ncbi:MAG: peroxiredoxin [Paraglaciecola sp.]|jgi:peroxiredoxin
MQFTVLLLAFLTAFTVKNDLQAQQNHSTNIYNIIGKVDSLAAETTVFLYTFDPITQSTKELDKSSIAENGTYDLSFLFQEADLFQIRFGRAQSVLLAIDKGQQNIKLDVAGKKKGFVRIQGSPDSELLQGYEVFRSASLARLITPTYATMRDSKGDAEKEVAAVQAYGHASEEHRKELIDYALKNMGTSVALYGTVLRWTGDAEIENLDILVNNFKKAHPDLSMTKVMEEKLNRFKNMANGVVAPDFSLPDTAGMMVARKDFKAKYTLLDFWASWCSPCLLQVPDLKKAHDTYHEKGFDIVGISVDKDERRWKSAIQRFDMNWLHLSDLKGWKSETARDYNVTFIPFNLLIDAEGRIVGKNLHSTELQAKLKELLGE